MGCDGLGRAVAENAIKDKGVKFFVQLLEVNTTIKYLDLNSEYLQIFQEHYRLNSGRGFSEALLVLNTIYAVASVYVPWFWLFWNSASMNRL